MVDRVPQFDGEPVEVVEYTIGAALQALIERIKKGAAALWLLPIARSTISVVTLAAGFWSAALLAAEERAAANFSVNSS